MLTTVQSWVRIPIHVQLCSAGFAAVFRVTAFYPRFTRLMVSRTHGGYAFTSTPKGWESHPHRNQVIHVAGTVPATCLSIPRLRRFRTNGSHHLGHVEQANVREARAVLFGLHVPSLADHLPLGHDPMREGGIRHQLLFGRGRGNAGFLAHASQEVCHIASLLVARDRIALAGGNRPTNHFDAISVRLHDHAAVVITVPLEVGVMRSST